MQKYSSIKELPAHLAEIYKVLGCAFPDGVSSEDYRGLLTVLNSEMSDRNLAELMAFYTHKDEAIVYNDVLSIATAQNASATRVAEIEEKLRACGYDDWLNQE